MTTSPTIPSRSFLRVIFLVLLSAFAPEAREWWPNETIVFGATTTENSTFGIEWTAGILAAFSESNSLITAQLSLIVLNDGGNATIAQQNIEELVTVHGAFAIIGGGRINTTWLWSRGVPVVCPTSGSSVYRVPGSLSLVLRPSYQDRIWSAINYVSSNWSNLKRPAILYYNTEPADELRAAFREIVGVEMLADEVYNPTEGVESVALRIAAAHPGVVFTSTASDVTAAFAVAYQKLDPSAVIHAIAIAEIEGLVNSLKEWNSTATVFTGAWLPDPEVDTSPLVTGFKRAMDLYQPGQPQTMTALEGYVSGSVAARFIMNSLYQTNWPLTQSNFIRGAFQVGRTAVWGTPFGQFVNASALWCNQAALNLRTLAVTKNGAVTEDLTTIPIDSCGNQDWEKKSLGLVGATISTGGTSTYQGRAAGKGIVNGLSSTENQQLTLVVLDDDYNPKTAAKNALILEPDVVALAIPVGTVVTLAVADAISNSTPLIGPYSGSPTLRQPFKRNIVNLFASTYDGIAVLVSFFINVKNCTRFGVIVQDDVGGVDGLDGLTLALREYNLKAISTTYVHRNGSNLASAFQAFSSGPLPEVAFVSSPVPVTVELIYRIRTTFPDMLVAPAPFGAGDMVAQSLVAKNCSLENFYSALVMPPVTMSSLPLVADFISTISDPLFNKTPYLAGYLTGRFLSEVAREISSTGKPVTKQAILDTIYGVQTFTIGGLTLGPFSDACLSKRSEATCCNQGSDKIWLVRFDEQANAIPVNFSFQIPPCGIVYSTDGNEFPVYGIVLITVFPFVTIIAVTVAIALLAHRANKRQVAELERKAVELEKKVKMLSNSHSHLLYTPAEHVIKLLTEMKVKAQLDDQDRENIGKIVLLIAQNKLYSANLAVPSEAALDADKYPAELDAEIEGYLRDTVLDHKAIDQPQQEKITRISSGTFGMSATSAEVIEEAKEASIQERLESWDFHPTTIDVPHDRMLSVVSVHLVSHYRLFKRLKLDKIKFVNWIQDIEQGYQENPYHNRLHAVDAVQSMHWLIQRSHGVFTNLEILAAIVSAAVHDFGHPGVNSSFLVKSFDPLAVRYNGISVLESMHASESIRLLLQTKNIFVAHFPQSRLLEFTEMIAQLVLATDMSRHVQIIGEANALAASGGFNFERASDRLLLLKLMIKVSDLSNSMRKLETYKTWTHALCEEFYAQGDRERESGFQVSPFMDRATASIPKMQKSFLMIVVKPLIDAIVRCIPEASELAANLEANAKQWIVPQSPTAIPPLPDPIQTVEIVEANV